MTRREVLRRMAATAAVSAAEAVVFPGLAILTAVLGFNLLADGLRD